MWTLRTTGGTDRSDATPVIMIIYDEHRANGIGIKSKSRNDN